VFSQILAPVADSLAFSALVAAIPLLALFIMLGIFKVPAWIAALGTIVLTIVVAVFGWHLPAEPAFAATCEGLFFGVCQIMWILIPAVWLYNLTVKCGWDKVLRDLLREISDDLRILAILIAFCFGALLEALAGFGTPVAITAAMMVAAGMKPLKAAMVCMVANTAPVAFGAMGAPITTLGNSASAGFGGADPSQLAEVFGAMAGRQSPFMAMMVPLFLVFLVDGVRGLKDTWHIALSGGVVFAAFQFVTSNFVNYQITDVVASIACIIAILLLLKVAKPAHPVKAEMAVDSDAPTPAQQTKGARRVVGAIIPYVIVVAIFAVSQIPAAKSWLASTFTVKFTWPGLESCFKADGATACVTNNIDLYSVVSTGTYLFIGGVITMLVYRMSVSVAAKEFGKTIYNLRYTIITIASVLALAYIMNASGMTSTLGAGLAASGAAFAFLSPVLGWLGVAITGSDVSSNALFGGMQVETAATVWGDVQHQVLMATSNSTGGCMGKMISPQSLSVAAAATGMMNKEGVIFRQVVGWSLVLLVIFALLVTLQATVLSFMIPVP
jgi:lactate permease